MSESVEITIIILTIVCIIKKTMILPFVYNVLLLLLLLLLSKSSISSFVHISFLYLKDILHKKSALED